MEDPNLASPEDVEFYAALGRAMDDWQLVEISLCNLFATTLRTPDERVAAEVFYSVQNFRDKLSMVDASVKFVFWGHRDLLPKWEKLRKKVDRRSKRRNTIVHAHTWSEHIGDGKMERRLGPQLALTRYLDAQSSPQKHFISIKQMNEAGRSFRAVGIRLKEFNDDIRDLLIRNI